MITVGQATSDHGCNGSEMVLYNVDAKSNNDMTVYERTDSLLPRKRDNQITKIVNLVIPVRKMFPLRMRRMTSRVKKNAGPSQESQQ
jgi:hypothetical protein